jgi:uncharacterized repeat protein (TIGR03803 family)
VGLVIPNPLLGAEIHRPREQTAFSFILPFAIHAFTVIVLSRERKGSRFRLGDPGPMHFARTIAARLIAAVCLLPVSLAFAGNASLLHTFTGGKDGSYPDGNISFDSAGNLYGTTQNGGTYGAGTVFEIFQNQNGRWQFSILYEFTGGTDGGNPLGSLIFDATGNAYATTSSGGTNGLGTVFELSPPANPVPGKPWTEKVLYSFQGGADGAIPFGNVIFDSAGNLYGTTSIGGATHIGCPPAKGCGTIYELSPSGDGTWKETILHRLTDAFGDGAEPRAGLVADASGNLYGTTYEGGDNLYCGGYGCGAVFEMVRPTSGNHWTYKNLINFTGNNGALIRGGVTFGPDGNLYGATLYGGANNAGTIFSLSPESGLWKLHTIYSFNIFDGLQPSGNLVFDQAGNIYGATYEGGVNDWGTVFQLVPGNSGWTENLLFTFAVGGTGYGANPLGGVAIDNSGNLYLTNNQGGNLNYCQPNSGCGTVIKISTSNE